MGARMDDFAVGRQSALAQAGDRAGEARCSGSEASTGWATASPLREGYTVTGHLVPLTHNTPFGVAPADI
jgi:hypothetical protein